MVKVRWDSPGRPSPSPDPPRPSPSLCAAVLTLSRAPPRGSLPRLQQKRLRLHVCGSCVSPSHVFSCVIVLHK